MQLPNDEHEYILDEIRIAVNIDGRCHLNMDDEKQTKSWKCNATCKTLNSEDRQIIVDLKNNFSDDCMEDIRDVLDSLDEGCQHGHYYKFFDHLVDTEENSDEPFNLEPLKKKKGHPQPCASSCCGSWLHLLRAAAVHYPILRNLLNNIYHARRSYNGIGM